MLRVGLIGCGGMGTNHAHCYGAMKDIVTLAAVADLDPAKTKNITEKFGGNAYATGMELLEKEDLDMVDICLPTYLHTAHAVAAMEKGLHVFMEKPVCLNMAEAKLLLDTQKKTGAKVQIGQVIRFWDEYAWLKETVEKGTYGRVLSASFIRLSANPNWGWENWYNKPERSGSMATDLHIHDVDYIRYLMNGEPDQLFSRATRNKEGVLQQIFTTYQYGDTIITSEGCWDYPDNYPFGMTFRVKLERATAIFDGGCLTVYLADGGKIIPEIKKEFEQDEDLGINISSLGAYYKELKYFAGRLISGEPLEIAPLSEAVKSLELDLKEIELAGGVVKK